MTQKFEMSMMGELKYFLGFQVKQLQEGTFLSQTKYTQDILIKFGMKDAKPIKTPIGTNGHLDLDEGGKSVDQKVYRSMIGSLLYLCASRPDIMLSVCMCDSRLEGVNRAKLKFTNINTTTSRISVRNKDESAREGGKQIASK
jgi:hypothetical protein